MHIVASQQSMMQHCHCLGPLHSLVVQQHQEEEEELDTRQLFLQQAHDEEVEDINHAQFEPGVCNVFQPLPIPRGILDTSATSSLLGLLSQCPVLGCSALHAGSYSAARHQRAGIQGYGSRGCVDAGGVTEGIDRLADLGGELTTNSAGGPLSASACTVMTSPCLPWADLPLFNKPALIYSDVHASTPRPAWLLQCMLSQGS